MKFKYPTQEQSVRGTKLTPILEIVTFTSKDALSAFYVLKQNKRGFEEYFEEARKIDDILPRELAEDVAERVID